MTYTPISLSTADAQTNTSKDHSQKVVSSSLLIPTYRGSVISERHD